MTQMPPRLLEDDSRADGSDGYDVPDTVWQRGRLPSFSAFLPGPDSGFAFDNDAATPFAFPSLPPLPTHTSSSPPQPTEAYVAKGGLPRFTNLDQGVRLLREYELSGGGRKPRSSANRPSDSLSLPHRRAGGSWRGVAQRTSERHERSDLMHESTAPRGSTNGDDVKSEEDDTNAGGGEAGGVAAGGGE
jgi:hypothetical protein